MKGRAGLTRFKARFAAVELGRYITTLWIERQAMSQAFKQYWMLPAAVVFLILTALACIPTMHRTPTADQEMVGRITSAPTTPEQIRRGALWYQLVLHPNKMNVRLRLLNPAPRTSFFLPGPWAGHNDFAEDITLSGARGPDGSLPIIIDRHQGRIDVETFNAAWVEIEYSVELHHQVGEQIRYRGTMREEVMLAYAPTFLILPSDGISRTLRDIAVELRVPTSWEVVTTWPRVHLASSAVEPETNVHGFVIDDIRSLRDAFIAAGPTIDAHHLLVDSRNMTIAFEPGFSDAREAIISAIQTITSYYMKRYGSRSDVTVFVTATPESTSEALRGMGRRGGFVLELPVFAKHQRPTNQRIDEQTLILIAHEAFHMWNGHELVADPAHERRTRWFKEGLTHYIALQSLRELGLIEEHTLLEELAKSAALYERNIEHRSRTNTTNSPNNPNNASIESARFPYDHGMMLALALDVAIHELGAPQDTLNDWIIALLAQTRAADFHQYTEQDLKHALLNSYAPAASRLNTIWVESIDQQRTIAVAKLFKSIGLYWLNNDPHNSPRLLPLEGKHPGYLQIFNGP